jgi:hypothetical protein
LKQQCSKCKRAKHLERQCGHILNLHSNLKHSQVVLTHIGTARQSTKSNGLMKMEIVVNRVQIQFYLDTWADVNIVSKGHLTTLVLIILRNVTKWQACTMVRLRHFSVKEVLCRNVTTMRPKTSSTSRHDDPLTYSAIKLRRV